MLCQSREQAACKSGVQVLLSWEAMWEAGPGLAAVLGLRLAARGRERKDLEKREVRDGGTLPQCRVTSGN